LNKQSTYSIILMGFFFLTNQCSSFGAIAITTIDGKKILLYEHSYALIVGNSNYQNFDSLPGAIKDAKDVAEALERKGFTVKLELNLTRDKFDSLFTKFALNQGNNINTRLLFYYAGHGATLSMEGDETMGYLVMIDTPKPSKDKAGFVTKSIDMLYLVQKCKMMKARHVLYMFDSCFSGTIMNFRSELKPSQISHRVKYPVRQFITAGSADEEVPDKSYFKQVFLDLIEGREEEPFKDGYITGEELGYYLKVKVPYYFEYQHPQFGKIKNPHLDKGDFIFLAQTVKQVKPKQVIVDITDKEFQEEKTSFYDVKTDSKVLKKKDNQIFGVEFVMIPQGNYQMGSSAKDTEAKPAEKPQHNIDISSFKMSKYEITNRQYVVFLNDDTSKGYSVNNYINTKSKSSKSHIVFDLDSKDFSVEPGYEDYPVVNVSWYGAKRYTVWFSERTGYRASLPTEAEWEYACRAKTKTSRFWGNNTNRACIFSNVRDISGNKNIKGLPGHQCDDGFLEISPIGNFIPNKFDLYDMLGNVYEWCEDVYLENAYELHLKQNPLIEFGGVYRVIRGGSWIDQPAEVRCANRSKSSPNDKVNYIGFRIVVKEI